MKASPQDESRPTPVAVQQGHPGEDAPAKRGPARRGRRRGRSARARVRVGVTLAFVAVIAVGYFLHVGIGNLCGIGFLDVALVCPLGALSAMISARTAIPAALISLVVFAVIVLVVGRAFCGWACPVPLVQRAVPGVNADKEARERRRRARERRRREREERLAREEAEEAAGAVAPAPAKVTVESEGEHHPTPSALSETERQEIRAQLGAGSAAASGPCAHGGRRGKYLVLLAALVSTALFGFPVFCLVCPVGLTFAFVLLVMRLFAFGELTWALVAFPAVVLVEVALLPRWCQSICPLGALHSLVAKGNVTLRPTVNASACLRETGASCHRCAQACPQGIDLHESAKGAPLSDCTKCGACTDACPVGAVSFPVLAKRG